MGFKETILAIGGAAFTVGGGIVMAWGPTAFPPDQAQRFVEWGFALALFGVVIIVLALLPGWIRAMPKKVDALGFEGIDRVELKNVKANGFGNFVKATDVGSIKAERNESVSDNFIEAERVGEISLNENRHVQPPRPLPRDDISPDKKREAAERKGYTRRLFSGWRPKD